MEYKICQKINMDEMMHLYESVQWLGYTKYPDKMMALIPNSLWWCAAHDKDELIGLVRVVGDGVSVVLVQDILIHPDHWRKGIATHLMKLALEEFKNVRQFLLITDNEEQTIKFYESLGLKTLDNYKGVGFIRYNFNA